MGRRNSFVSSRIRVQQEVKRKRVVQAKAQTQLAKATERAKKAYENSQRADQKERV